MCINFLPPLLSLKFCNKRKKIGSIHADQHTNTTDLYIKSINLVRHPLLSVNMTARLLKGACLLSYPWVFFLATISACAFSCSLWIGSPNLSIATRGIASPYRPVGPGQQIFDLITLQLVIKLIMHCWVISELKVLVRSVRTSHACNFQDIWKWLSARPTSSRKACHAPSPQQLPPCKLSEENVPTWLWEVV